MLLRSQDPRSKFIGQHVFSEFRILFLAGDRCDPDTLIWAQDLLQVPVIDHWWQTETGWSIAANCMGIEPLPVKPGSPTKAVPGWDLHVLDAEGKVVAPGTIGALVGKLPMPPGSSPTLWNAKRSEEHTSELQSLMRISYAVFCLQKKKIIVHNQY